MYHVCRYLMYFYRAWEPEGAACFWPLGAGATCRKENRSGATLEEKKTEAGAAPKTSGTGAAKNLRLLYWLLEDKKHMEIVHLLQFFR